MTTPLEDQARNALHRRCEAEGRPSRGRPFDDGWVWCVHRVSSLRRIATSVLIGFLSRVARLRSRRESVISQVDQT